MAYNKGRGKRARKAARRHPKLILILIILLVLVIAAAAILWFVKPDLYHKFIGVGDHTFGEWTYTLQPTCSKKGERERECKVCGLKQKEEVAATGEHTFDGDGICTVCGTDKNFAGTPEGVAASAFSMHFIDLGKFAGDSIYIKAGENDILIDAGSRADSAPLICRYLNSYVTDGKLEYVVATHADQDHIAAFAGSKSGSDYTGVLYNYKVDNLIKFDNVEKSKNKNESNTNTVYGKFMAAVEHVREEGGNVFTASQCYEETDGAKRQYWLDDAHTLSMNILWNYYYYNVSSDENNHSVVTLFTQSTSSGKINCLFTGDLEEDGERRMVDYYSSEKYDALDAKYKTEYNVLPEVKLYKAGHHGSGTSSSPKLLSAIKPEYVAVSCCAGAPEYTVNPDNTFPYRKVFENLLKYTDKIYVTGQAINLPALEQNDKGETVFSDQKWDYEPRNGNMVFYFNKTKEENGLPFGSLKLLCGNDGVPITSTDWYSTYRSAIV